MDSCNPVEEDIFNVLAALGDKVVEQDAVVILNNMSNAETALLVLKYFQQRLKLSKEVIIYNVTLKVLRKSKDLDRAEKLFDEMLQREVKPDNVTSLPSLVVLGSAICLKKLLNGSKSCLLLGVNPMM